MSVLSQPQFHCEEAAFAWLEAKLWPEGPLCPHCGCMGRISKIKANKEARVRLGLHRCNDCKKQFTVKVGTVFEHARIPLNKMLQAVHLMCSSKKGISAHQLHRILEVQYRSAWFLAHRIREAMRDGSLAPMGGAGGIVEADETYFGEKEAPEVMPASRRGQPYTKGGRAGVFGKRAVMALVERGGSVRSFHIDRADKATVQGIVTGNLNRETRLMTDESRLYGGLSAQFLDHQTVRHSAGEYVRLTDREVHSNTVEGYFSIFKRGMKGVYQHCAEKHLHRYLAEFDFRYNNRAKLGVNDVDRSNAAVKGIVGKRLTYGGSHAQKVSQG